LVVFVREIKFGVKDIFEVSLEKLLLPVDSVLHGELIELVELDECEAEAVKSALERILLPVLQLDSQNVLNELEEIIV